MSGVHNISLDDIGRAIRAGSAAVEALRTWVRGAEAYRICDERERAIQHGEAALTKLEREWSRIKSVVEATDRSYDLYVSRGADDEPQGCSCHLSAPCSWCTMQPDPDEPAKAQAEAGR